jgi:hypothetical protein
MELLLITGIPGLRKLGFRWIWFDGNRVAARRAFIARGTVPEHLLDLQMQRIEQHLGPEPHGAKVIDTFDADGVFLPHEEITNPVLAEGSAKACSR